MTLSDADLRSIGRIAVNFQFVERVIVFYMCELIGPDQTIGHIFSTQLSFGRLCAATKALFEYQYQDQSLRARFGELIAKALELEVRRNQYFHSAWGFEDESGSTVRSKTKLSRKGELVGDMLVVEEAELEQVNEQLKACGSRLLSFGSEIGLLRGAPE